jgi:hypothetical protein
LLRNRPSSFLTVETADDDINDPSTQNNLPQELPETDCGSVSPRRDKLPAHVNVLLTICRFI